MIPHFIIDDDLEELQRNITDILQEKKHPELKKHTKTLKTFTRAIAYSLAKPKRKKHKKIKKHIPIEPIKLETIEKLKEVVKEPTGFDIGPIPLPGDTEKQIHEFKAIPKYEKLAGKLEHKEELIPLIRDKFTNRVLSTAKVNGSYKINEPTLNETNQKILDKIMKKKPKNPEKAWKLIEKYIKKFKGDPEHKEAIKYYVINNLFALGKIEPLLQDKNISLISCSSPGSYIEVKRNDKKLKTNILFKDKKELDNFLFLIAEKTNSKLNKKHPILDATYRNFRFHCVLGLDITTSKFNITRI